MNRLKQKLEESKRNMLAQEGDNELPHRDEDILQFLEPR